MSITKIASGGQTGAERGALDAAIEINIPHGGWCPKGRLAEDGIIPEKYQLMETDFCDSQDNTEQNIVESHFTLLFSCRDVSERLEHVIDLCEKHGKEFLLIDMEESGDDEMMEEILAIMAHSDLKNKYPPDFPVINVVGTEESKAPGIQGRVKKIMLGFCRKQEEDDKRYEEDDLNYRAFKISKFMDTCIHPRANEIDNDPVFLAILEVMKRLPEEDFYKACYAIDFVIQMDAFRAINVPVFSGEEMPVQPNPQSQKRRDLIVIFKNPELSHRELLGLVAHEIAHSFVKGRDDDDNEKVANDQVRKWGFGDELDAMIRKTPEGSKTITPRLA